MDATGQRILIFGDSLSHPGSDSGPEVHELPTTASTSSSPGARFGQLLLDAGAAAVRIDARVGRSAWNFYKREAYTALLKADRAWGPTRVFVILGTNDIGLSMDADKTKMQAIRDAFPDAEVWGIGPPTFESSTRNEGAADVVAMMQTVFGARFIDTRTITSDLIGDDYRTSDGIHFKTAGAKLFAERLAAVVADTNTVSSLRFVLGIGATAALAGVAWIIGRRMALGATRRPGRSARHATESQVRSRPAARPSRLRPSRA